MFTEKCNILTVLFCLTCKTRIQVSTGGHDLASGEFSYDSKANKFRFVEDTTHANKTSHMDVLIHFEEVGLVSNSLSLSLFLFLFQLVIEH